MENKIEISMSLFENFAFYYKDTFSVEGAKPTEAECFQKQEIYIFDHLNENCLKMMALCKERAAENKLRETFQIKDETNEKICYSETSSSLTDEEKQKFTQLRHLHWMSFICRIIK